MGKEKPLLNKQWTQADFDNPDSDQNIYKRLLENDKKKIKPGLREFMIYAREQLGITQEQMARQLDIKQNALSRYENGARRVPIYVFLGVAEMIGYEIVISKRKEKWGSNDEIVKEYEEEKKQW
jgi:DNA-binding XRE family transcriptional regulator